MPVQATIANIEVSDENKALFLDRLAQANKLDPNSSPFPMGYVEGRHYQMGRRDILEWVADLLNLYDHCDRDFEPMSANAMQKLISNAQNLRSQANLKTTNIRLLFQPSYNDKAYLLGQNETLQWVSEMIG